MSLKIRKVSKSCLNVWPFNTIGKHRRRNRQDYNIAYELYVDYMKTFPDGHYAYDMGYYFAELLMTLQKWEDAAANYERILAAKPNGEHSKEAAAGGCGLQKTTQYQAGHGCRV